MINLDARNRVRPQTNIMYTRPRPPPPSLASPDPCPPAWFPLPSCTQPTPTLTHVLAKELGDHLLRLTLEACLLLPWDGKIKAGDRKEEEIGAPVRPPRPGPVFQAAPTSSQGMKAPRPWGVTHKVESSQPKSHPEAKSLRTQLFLLLNPLGKRPGDPSQTLPPQTLPTTLTERF